MKNSFLDFEKPIADIYDKIQALKDIVNESPELLPQIAKLEEEEKIITNTEDDVSADRLKNAAATKKLAIFDAFEILNRIQEEANLLEGKTPEKTEKKAFKGFAEGRSK